MEESEFFAIYERTKKSSQSACISVESTLDDLASKIAYNHHEKSMITLLIWHAFIRADQQVNEVLYKVADNKIDRVSGEKTANDFRLRMENWKKLAAAVEELLG